MLRKGKSLDREEKGKISKTIPTIPLKATNGKEMHNFREQFTGRGAAKNSGQEMQKMHFLLVFSIS